MNTNYFDSHNIKIYTDTFTNGSYSLEHDNKLVYDSETIDTSNSDKITVGISGSVGLTGPRGGDYVSLADIKYVPRVPIIRSYKAYKILITPKENTQESFDNMVSPFFLALNDIGCYLGIIQPIQTTEKLGLKDEYKPMLANITRSITEFYNTVEQSYKNRSIYKDDFRNFYPGNLVINGTFYDYGYILDDIVRMFKELHDYDTCLEQNSDNEYMIKPYQTPLEQYLERISKQNWYNYETNVNFQVPLTIKCHEYTNTYKIIQEFLSKHGCK